MFALILTFAQKDDNIRAVILNGSRANPNAARDDFQDFDIACVVRAVTSFWNNPQVPAFFGELIILQTPENMGDTPAENDGHYSYLMQFMDGNRIDLSFHPLEAIPRLIQDSLSIVLLDKDGCIPTLPPASESSYLPRPPTAKQFADCCNEFWWLNPYVAKALWRSEIPHAKYLLDTPLRGQLMKILTWHFGVLTSFSLPPGKMGKRFPEVLDAALWSALLSTYSDAQPENVWAALLKMDTIFRQTAHSVANHFNYPYPTAEDKKVSNFVQHIHSLC